jgi:hypothetical protein
MQSDIEDATDDLDNIKHRVGIDCEPGSTRPGTYFALMCSEVNVDIKWFSENPTKFLGAWVWIVRTEYNNSYEDKMHLIHDYLSQLHEKGEIRGAEVS